MRFLEKKIVGQFCYANILKIEDVCGI